MSTALNISPMLVLPAQFDDVFGISITANKEINMQSIAQVERASDREFRIGLEKYLNRGDECARKAAMIEQRAKDMMQKNEWCDPWSFTNFTEAIENAPEHERKLMFSTVAEAVSQRLDNNHTNHLALVALRQMVERYWLDVATKEALKELA